MFKKTTEVYFEFSVSPFWHHCEGVYELYYIPPLGGKISRLLFEGICTSSLFTPDLVCHVYMLHFSTK